MDSNKEASDIINLLKDIADKCNFSVFIPSLNKEALFKQLSTEQLKRIYKTAIDANLFSVEFVLVFNEIIKENCLDNLIDVNELDIYDKIFIFLKTRIESLSPDFKFPLTDKEKQALNITADNISVSLLDHYNKLKTKIITFQEKEIVYNNCKVICNLPTLQTENNLDSELLKQALTENTTDNDLLDIVSNVFVNEIGKFVTMVIIDDTICDLQNLKITDRAKIIEQLPSLIIKDVLGYIEDYKKQTRDHLLVTIKSNNETTLSKQIPYNSLFFNI
jgi:hypothetical protein